MSRGWKRRHLRVAMQASLAMVVEKRGHRSGKTSVRVLRIGFISWDSVVGIAAVEKAVLQL